MGPRRDTLTFKGLRVRRTMRHTAWSGLWALGVGMFMAACGGEKPRPTAPPTNMTDKDAGEISGSEPYDGSVPLPRKDAGPIMIPPGDPEEGLIGECAVD